MSESHRQSSRKEWITPHGLHPSIDQIQLGCLQRIADATEKMAGNYDALIHDRDLYKRWYNEERERNARLERRIRSLRGVITRMKRKQQEGK